MIVFYYESVKGGVNNLAVALDTRTGETSSSLRGAEYAEKALRRKLSRLQKNNFYGGNKDG